MRLWSADAVLPQRGVYALLLYRIEVNYDGIYWSETREESNLNFKGFRSHGYQSFSTLISLLPILLI